MWNFSLFSVRHYCLLHWSGQMRFVEALCFSLLDICKQVMLGMYGLQLSLVTSHLKYVSISGGLDFFPFLFLFLFPLLLPFLSCFLSVSLLPFPPIFPPFSSPLIPPFLSPPLTPPLPSSPFPSPPPCDF